MRIWCRKKDAWLSFKTTDNERYLINPQGYYIELPEGSLTPISPRTTFPVIEQFPSVPVSHLAVRTHFGPDTRFISVPLHAQKRQEPMKVEPAQLMDNPLQDLNFPVQLTSSEQYALLRAIEHGAVSWSEVARLASMRDARNTMGELLITAGPCNWEQILAYSLDVRPPSRLDPPQLRSMIERREWELTGEILVAMGKVNRTQLEHALKVKREGAQALGQILTAMGACKDTQIEHCLKLQHHLQNVDNEGIVLIGTLLVAQKIISDDDLEEVLRKQRVARQPLGRILISMGACTQRDIDDYERVFGSTFQQQIDEAAMGAYLVNVDTITKIQLEEALRIQHRGRQVLGEMTVAMGLCTAQDIDHVVSLQNEIRDHHRSGVQRLGDLLIRKGYVPPAKIDEAVQLQSIARQPFGAILVALGACNAQDVRLALEIQEQWRARPKAGDRLGEVLVKYDIVTEDKLEQPLLQHMREAKPLGRILVENGICKPEQIIDVLISRDRKRQEEFTTFVHSHLTPADRPAAAVGAPGHEGNVLQKISLWITKKDKG